MVSHPDGLWLLSAPAGQEPCPVLGAPWPGQGQLAALQPSPTSGSTEWGGVLCSSVTVTGPRSPGGAQGARGGSQAAHGDACRSGLSRVHCPCHGEQPRAGLQLEFLFPALVTPEHPVAHRLAHPLLSPTVASAHPSARLRRAGLGSGASADGARLCADSRSSSPETVRLLRAGSSPSGCQVTPGLSGGLWGGEGRFWGAAWVLTPVLPQPCPGCVTSGEETGPWGAVTLLRKSQKEKRV